MITKLKYLSFIFLYLLFQNNSYGLTINDASILKNILQCTPKTTSLGSASVCSEWTVDVPDAVNIKSADEMKPRCIKYTTITSSSADGSNYDNVGMVKKITTRYDVPQYSTRTVYNCADGSKSYSPNCAVLQESIRLNKDTGVRYDSYSTDSTFHNYNFGKHCHYVGGKIVTLLTGFSSVSQRCDTYAFFHDACNCAFGNGSYALCTDGKPPCSQENAACRVRTINTRYWEYGESYFNGTYKTEYAHSVSFCDAPKIKSITISQLYDPNLVSQ
ncbi:MAG: hypothetical protein LBU68_00555 [Rickettsiales bacterium]|jgi:hypothetical protein|nr:hypothetical protein [Rickettsiales bacterium]